MADEKCTYCGAEADSQKMLLMVPANNMYKKWSCRSCFEKAVEQFRELALDCLACRELLDSMEMALECNRQWFDEQGETQPVGVAINPSSFPHRAGCPMAA